jgi:hypothetical protein
VKLFVNRELTRIFGSKREEITNWERLHKEELHNLYSLPTIIRVLKPNRTRWAGHVARSKSTVRSDNYIMYL